jgi:hypothetical protein
VPLPLARTPAEKHLYIDLHPCACGERATEFVGHALLDYAGGLAGRDDTNCRGCGQSRQFMFRVPDWPLQLGRFSFGDERPSQLIDPGEWLWVASTAVVIGMREHESEADLRESLAYASAAAAEVVKFLPPEADEIPDHLFPSQLGQAVRKVCPPAFRLPALHSYGELTKAGSVPAILEAIAAVHPTWNAPDDIMRNALLDGILARIRRYVGGDRTAVLEPEAVMETDALIGRNTTFDLMGSFESALLRWLRYKELPEGERQENLVVALRLFAAVQDAALRHGDLELVEAIPAAVRLLLAQRDRL